MSLSYNWKFVYIINMKYLFNIVIVNLGNSFCNSIFSNIVYYYK